jgi:hypothetical protein
MPKRRVDPEVWILTILRKLDPSARLRVLDYVRRRVANPKVVVVSGKRSWLPQRPGWPVA